LLFLFLCFFVAELFTYNKHKNKTIGYCSRINPSSKENNFSQFLFSHLPKKKNIYNSKSMNLPLLLLYFFLLEGSTPETNDKHQV
jgi:hypothetical protein